MVKKKTPARSVAGDQADTGFECWREYRFGAGAARAKCPIIQEAAVKVKSIEQFEK
jgi:hypothetical protein